MSITSWLRDHRPVSYAEVAAQRERLDEWEKFFAVLAPAPERPAASVRAAERWGTAS